MNYVQEKFYYFMTDIIEIVLQLLDIESPGFSFDGKFATPTTMSEYNRKIDTVFINPDYCVDSEQSFLLLLFSVIHELKHKQQYKNNVNCFSGYKRSNQMSLEEYNSQFVEVDANSFSLAFMDNTFRDWDNLGLHKKVMKTEPYTFYYKAINKTLKKAGIL